MQLVCVCVCVFEGWIQDSARSTCIWLFSDCYPLSLSLFLFQSAMLSFVFISGDIWKYRLPKAIRRQTQSIPFTCIVARHTHEIAEKTAEGIFISGQNDLWPPVYLLRKKNSSIVSLVVAEAPQHTQRTGKLLCQQKQWARTDTYTSIRYPLFCRKFGSFGVNLTYIVTSINLASRNHFVNRITVSNNVGGEKCVQNAIAKFANDEKASQIKIGLIHAANLRSWTATISHIIVPLILWLAVCVHLAFDEQYICPQQ